MASAVSENTLESLRLINKELGSQIEHLKKINSTMDRIDLQELKAIAARQRGRLAARAKHKKLGTTKGNRKGVTAIDDLTTVLEMLGVEE